MAIQIIPIDCGRNTVKLLNNQSFRSVVGDWHHREISDNEEYEVIINDKEKHFVKKSTLVCSWIFDAVLISIGANDRSEERRVGKECRSRWSPYH